MPNVYRLVYIKIELIEIELTRKTRIVTISVKLLEVSFGNSIIDNSKLDKISDGKAKKSISATEWDSTWEVKR